MKYVGALIIAVCALSTAAAEPQWRFDGVHRVVAVSDAHGALDALQRVLRNADLIDAKGAWIGGASHLVVAGDMLDRGGQSRAIMDLFMGLEPAAQRAQGAVHVVLGNHEVMNLLGDLRYVADAEYAAMADLEQPADRANARAAMPAEATDAQFNERFPPGFFGHRRAFGPEGRYGRWLLGLPLMVVIGETAFVHGGFLGAPPAPDPTRINDELRAQLLESGDALSALSAGGVLAPGAGFYDQPALLDAYRARVERGEATWTPAQAALAERLTQLQDGALHGGSSPLWYRGNVGCSAVIEAHRLESALAKLGAKRLVVGHTPTANAHVMSRLDGRVLRIDTGMLASYYKGRAAALIIEDGQLSVVYEDADAPQPPMPQPRRVGSRPQGIDDAALEQWLASAEIVGSKETDSSLLILQGKETRFQARFVRSRGGHFPELAAYRLDRAVGLDMVPVTVMRTVDGKPGTLQFAPERAVTETQRNAGQRGQSAWCPLGDQFKAMYVFDALLNNGGRSPQTMNYTRDAWSHWQLLLSGHADAFATSRGFPEYLERAGFKVTAGWREALRRLDDDWLNAHLSDVLNKRRLAGLAKRRDKLLEHD